MKSKPFSNFWTAFANFQAMAGFSFNDLIDLEESPKEVIIYKGAWANIIVRADTSEMAADIVSLGLAELNFELISIDKIENVSILMEKQELKSKFINEVKWLKKSEFVFKIYNRIYPYY